MHFNKIVLALAAAGFASGAYATNGMNMEAYGPIAGGMGGASFAYDNGTAAMMNNPATLGLMTDPSRLDVAIGFLGPDVTAKFDGSSSDSDGDSYFMPAVGYARKHGAFTYGVGVFAQGGMGTEWGDDAAFDPTGGAKDQRSELGVGRVILPLSYQATPDLVVGGSIDYVWAMLDIQWALSGAQFAQFIPAFGGGSSAIGTASGSMVDGLVYNVQNNLMPPPNWAYFDFSDGSSGDDAYTGKAKGQGWAGKLGFVYKVSPTLSIGGTYHSETNLDDLEGDAKLSMNIGPEGGMTIPVHGEVKVKDFQWPETYGLGVAWQATDRLMVAADYKRINWGDVMKDFKMSFKADSSQSNPMAAGFAGAEMDMVLAQDWDDQDVFQIGVSYKATDAWTLRAGASFADNPIPDQQMNPLFPAIVEDHYTVGFGYAFNKVSDVNFSFTYAPEVDQTVSTGGLYAGTKVEHSQTNAQLMYSHRF